MGARRRGKKIATTAIARKLLTRAYHLLTSAEVRAQATATAPAPAPPARLLTGRVAKPRASSQNRMSRPRRAR